MSEGIEIGSTLDGRYEILSVLGSGGMGCVYKARQLHLDRLVAIKVPSETMRENTEFLTRFVREARACAKIAHDHIVAIYDVHSGERPYIVMEFVDGMPLSHFLHEQHSTLFVSDLLEIIDEICEGLSAAHASGVVHRDIKPGNIVIAQADQRVKIMDFGIARISSETALTVSGSMMGTPYYMAPEQIRGEEVTPATDLYALAAMIYQLFTGKFVFEGEITALIYKHVSAPPVPPSEVNPMLPKTFDEVLLRALEKQAARRHESTLDFARELRMALRPIANLPYSQVLVQTARSMAVANAAKKEKKPELFDPKAPLADIGLRVAHSAPLHPISTPTPKGPRTPAHLSTDPLTPTQPLAAEGKHAKRHAKTEPQTPLTTEKRPIPFGHLSSSIRALFIASALLGALGLGGVLGVWLFTGKPKQKAIENLPAQTAATPGQIAGSSKGQEPLSPPGQQPLSEPTATPTAYRASTASLHWIREPQRRYLTSDWLKVQWRSAAPDGAHQPRVYRITLRNTKTGKILFQALTQSPKFVRPLQEKMGGEYDLIIQAQGDAGVEFAPLKAAFTLQPGTSPHQ